jgi:hypothetical protein
MLLNLPVAYCLRPSSNATKLFRLQRERFFSFLAFVFSELPPRFLYLSGASAYPEITLFLLNFDDL